MIFAIIALFMMFLIAILYGSALIPFVADLMGDYEGLLSAVIVASGLSVLCTAGICWLFGYYQYFKRAKPKRGAKKRATKEAR